jgi:hypothetical protein
VGSRPQRPQYKIVVDLGRAGKFSAAYHAIEEGNGILALVYDTRYEDGTQWVPPDLGRDELMTLHLPDQDVQYQVASFGHRFPLGVLDIIILIKVDQEEP